MNKKRHWFFIVVVTLFVMNLSLPALGLDDGFSRESLRGFKQIFVVVEGLKPEIEKRGLTEAQIKTDVELKLRLAGIQVLPVVAILKKPGTPCLYLNPQVAMASDLQHYVYCVDISLLQAVSLKINPQMERLAVTWSSGYLGLTVKLKDIRAVIQDQVDKFINAYLSVNPK